MADILSPLASTSKSTESFCSICNQTYSKYTCPRCSFRTCSLPCSSAHKTRDGCSGIRDKAKYVPMNQYGWGTMMDDYAFLEDVGRRVGDWGMEIGRGGFATRTADRGRGRGRGRGRKFAGHGHTGRTKQDILKQQLELRDIDMELLPTGMERSKQNKSTWDFKNQTALLTIEYKFYRQRDPSAPSTQPREPPFRLLAHKNRFDTQLLTLVQSKVRERSTNAQSGAPLPPWITEFLHPDPDDPESFAIPQFLMSAHVDPRSGLRSKSTFYKLDPREKLSVILRDTPFVEFPTVEIWEDGDDAFKGTIVDAQGGITAYADTESDGERRRKRRKLDIRAGKKAIHGLLGGYGSEEEEDDDGDQGGNPMALLGGYDESEEDEDLDADADAEGETDEDPDGDDNEVDLAPAALIELVKQAQALDSARMEEEELLDWGDSDDEGVM